MRDYTLPVRTLGQLATLSTALPDDPLPKVINDLLPPAPAQPPKPSIANTKTGVAFIDAFKKKADTLIATDKGGTAHTETGSALVDLDFEFKPPADVEALRVKLKAAWAEDPDNTLRLIFQTRSIHEGKGFKAGFWVAAGWLFEHHPRCLIENLHVLVDPTCERPAIKSTNAATKVQKDNLGVETLDEEGEIEKNIDILVEYPARPHGCYDDLNDLLMLAINGRLSGTYSGPVQSPEEYGAPASLRFPFKEDRLNRAGDPSAKRGRKGFAKMGAMAKSKSNTSFEYKVLTAGTKERKHEVFRGRLVKALETDQKFQALYLMVVHLFVKQMKADISLLDKHTKFLKQSPSPHKRAPFSNNSSPFLFGMSYAGKWAASQRCSADRQLLLTTAMATILIPGEENRTARCRLHQRFLGPLRAALAVPETRMTKGEWRIDYTKVPARCMSINSAHFMAHDPKGFEAFLNKVASGRVSISGASMLPHEILMDACGNDAIRSRVADLQWRTLVESIRTSSTSLLQNSLAIADVSGSMGTYLSGDKKHPQPINVCLALTLLLGELSAAPWSGMFFTFSSVPTAEYIDPSIRLSERAKQLQQAHWQMSTNFYKVFDLILQTAVREKLPASGMVKKLFVFSDMQFDAAVDKSVDETEYMAIKRKFEKEGYELPELVFWNLHSSSKTPVPVRADKEGVSLMSGFSGAQMKYFLREQVDVSDAELKEIQTGVEALETTAPEKVEGGAKQGAKGEAKDTPLQTLLKVLSAESFKGIKLVD